MRIAILVPPADYKAEWRWTFDPQADALRSAGAKVEPKVWTERTDWRAFDLVLPLVAWGYHTRFTAWTALLGEFEASGVSVLNPVPVLRWNSDKAYLAELGSNGVATVPSMVFDKLDEQALELARASFGESELVVKPLISASAWGTHRCGEGDDFPEQVRGWRMLVQPWLRNITASGEWSLIYFGGVFSHALSKVPRPGEFRVQPEYGGIIDRCDPPAGTRELAEAALAAAPAATAYARIDIVEGNDGSLQVMELELVEPALFLHQAPDRAEHFAQAMLSAAGNLRK